MAKLFENSGDPDQRPHSAASHLGLHRLPITLLQVSQLQWVKWLKNLPNWFFMFIDIEFMCAFDAYNLLTAFRDLRISFARILHADFSPFLAASFRWRFVFSSSLWIAN